jgi:hypothetical protein
LLGGGCARASRNVTSLAVITRFGCHHPPPGLAFGEPDDRLQRAIQYAAAYRMITASLEYWVARSSRAMTVVIIVRRHRPRKRTIQYAAAYRMIISVSGILGRPVKPGEHSRN